MEENVFSVSDFVAVLNQTLEYAYPSVMIQGELSNLRVSKNKWVYFDLKDEFSSVKFFGTIYQLPGPLEDGMMLQVRGVPRLHQLYGFSVNVQFMQPVGEGSIKKAAALLEAKLTAEGLFDADRKRVLPYPPLSIGLITSSESAAYVDFMKILNARWGGVEVLLADVQVQGEAAINQIVAAIEHFNTHSDAPDVLVITRGGGSANDLAVFNTEQITRAIAGSRSPTLVAIGHEVDISLAELAADQRASTPSNAAELLTPDKKQLIATLTSTPAVMEMQTNIAIARESELLLKTAQALTQEVVNVLSDRQALLTIKEVALRAYNPADVLKRGYALIKSNGKTVRSIHQVDTGSDLELLLADGTINAKVK